MPRSSFLHLVAALLSLLLAAGSTLAKGSGFNVKAHGTGFKSVSGSLADDNVGVSTSNDMLYTVQITLGWENFTVQLDTGSSDLWLNTAGRNVQITNTSDLLAIEAYGSGEVEGNIAFAQLQIGDLTIESQAFLNVSKTKDFDLSSFDGIMGMAFDIGSIYGTVQKAWGTDAADSLARSPITALFAEDPSLPNNFDVQLARTSELEDVANGTFLISSHAEDFERVATAPKLPRVTPDHWSIVVDGMLINGQPFQFNTSRIDGVPQGTIVAALDTGFSLPPLPPAAVDAIYSSIPGAMYDSVSNLWLVPCNGTTAVTFVFGGEDFPVHPLDLTIPVVVTLPINGQATKATVCINAYEYLTLDPNAFTGFDIILGDAFLRNVYASFDYGDWDPTSSQSNTTTPFVQMVSTTNSAEMFDEFQTSRFAALANLPPTVDPAFVIQLELGSSSSTTGPSSQTASSAQTSSTATKDTDTLAKVAGAISADETSSSDSGWSSKYGKIVLGVLGANLLIGIVLLAATLTMCVRGMKGRSVGSRYAPVRFKDNTPADDDLERSHLKYSD